MAVFFRKLTKNNFRAIFPSNKPNIIGKKLGFDKKNIHQKRWNLNKWLSNIFVPQKHIFNKSHISYYYAGHTPILLFSHLSYWSYTHPNGYSSIEMVTHPSYWSRTLPSGHTRHRALCSLFKQDTDGTRVSKCRQLSTQMSVYTHPSPSIIYSPADQVTFSRTAGQSQVYYNTLKVRVGHI